jgi:hypothetical protein
VLNEVSQIVLKIDFVFVIGTTPFQFSLKITQIVDGLPGARFLARSGRAHKLPSARRRGG